MVKRRKTKRRTKRTKRNPFGIPTWLLLAGGAGAYLLLTKSAGTVSGLTLADLEKTVVSKMLGKATNVKAVLNADGSVVVGGKYGGNDTFVFISSKSASEAWTLSQKLSVDNPYVKSSDVLSGIGCVGCLGYIVGG